MVIWQMSKSSKIQLRLKYDKHHHKKKSCYHTLTYHHGDLVQHLAKLLKRDPPSDASPHNVPYSMGLEVCEMF